MYSLAWMSGTLLSFCLMAVAARELSGDLSIFQTLFFRSVIGLVILTFVIGRRGCRHYLSTQRVGLHVLRNIFHFAGQYGWFLGIGLLPLAEVFALEFTVPVWTAIIAAVFLKERATLRNVSAITLGLVGVFIIVKPGYAIIDTASWIVLGAAICFSIVHTSTKSLSVTENPITIIFYMCLVQLSVGLLLTISQWVWPTGLQWGWLVIIGVTALSAHYCLTMAMQFADVTTIVTIDFLRLPLITLVGVLLYKEPFALSLIVGGLFMLAGNLINFHALPTEASRKSRDASHDVAKLYREE